MNRVDMWREDENDVIRSVYAKTTRDEDPAVAVGRILPYRSRSAIDQQARKIGAARERSARLEIKSGRQPRTTSLAAVQPPIVERLDPRPKSLHAVADRVPLFLRSDFARWGVQ